MADRERTQTEVDLSNRIRCIMRSKSSEVAPLEALRQKFLHSAQQERICRMLQEAEALVKDVTALGRWPRDSKNNPNERSLIRRIRELRDAQASGDLQTA